MMILNAGKILCYIIKKTPTIQLYIIAAKLFFKFLSQHYWKYEKCNVRADVGDLHFIESSMFLSIQGKGHDEKSSKVLVASQVQSFIEEYLKTRNNPAPNEPLFTSTSRQNFNQRLDTQSISKLVKAKLREINIDDSRHTAHSLRHTAATQALLNGVPLTQVQQVLRYTNINTTLIYSHAIERMKNKSEQTVADVIFN